MKRNYFILFIAIASIVIFIQCDSPSSPKDYSISSSYVDNLIISPENIVFDALADGVKDTAVTLTLKVEAYNLETDSFPHFYIYEDGIEEPLVQGVLNADKGKENSYSKEIILNTRTNKFENYSILVTAYNRYAEGNFIKTNFGIMGMTYSKPEIIEINNPEGVVIPTGNNTVVVLFTAKVTDPDGQDNIENVFLNFRNEDGTLLSSTPFTLLDDGKNSNTNDSGDEIANDSVYTTRFGINSSNTPHNRTAFYWAIDKTGLSSDTLTAPFSIIEQTEALQ